MEQIVLTPHARFEMSRRQVEESLVLAVVRSPQQVLSTSQGRIIHQSRYFDPIQAKEMLLRVILEQRAGNLYVVTIYRTSRVDKYWRRGAQ